MVKIENIFFFILKYLVQDAVLLLANYLKITFTSNFFFKMYKTIVVLTEKALILAKYLLEDESCI